MTRRSDGGERGEPRFLRGRATLRMAVLIGFFALPVLAVPKPSSRPDPARQASASIRGWVRVDYGSLVDRRRPSHSGDPIGVLLDRLGGRPFPTGGDRPEDALSHRLLDPLLETYAFVLPDALDSSLPMPEAPFVEVGNLWSPGEEQPAWAEMLRARQFVLESDGRGHLRACLPLPRLSDGTVPTSLGIPVASGEEAGKKAWDAAWPVLRHALAAERRRLARRAGDRPEDHPLDVEVHAYAHAPEITSFVLGLDPLRVRVDDTRALPAERLPDLRAWQSFLDRGLQIEGGRLDPEGTLHLLGSEPAAGGSVRARPLTLADFAVAYRAVARGGLAEPYMSLDRGEAPETSIVNYGGRLRDTRLGLTSLLSDVRFKTMSLGIDVFDGRDVRGRIREALPAFRTHLERFALDPSSKGVMAQQTRLWFYPDDVSVTLSPEGDVLVMRRARMTAASERVGARAGAAEPDPPWTRDTVAFLNRNYDGLCAIFPELTDLDQATRLLTLFTWLRQASAEGHPVPDLDALLGLPLPPVPTPRRFPQLLTFNALPPAGGTGDVDVLDRTTIGDALERLTRPDVGILPAARRFARAKGFLDRRLPDQDALAKEMEARDPAKTDDATLDLLAYRAERLFMHERVLASLSRGEREALDRRAKTGGSLRVFSVGIGGVDLGMGAVLARASRAQSRLSWGGGSPRRVPAAAESARAPEGAAARSAPPATGAAAPAGASPGEDSPLIAVVELPDHGLPASGKGDSAEYPSHWIRTGKTDSKEGARSWVRTVYGADGPEPRARLVVLNAERRAQRIERLEDGRFLQFEMEREGTVLRARSPLESGSTGIDAPWLAPDSAAAAAPSPGQPEVPAGIGLLEVVAPGPSALPAGESPKIALRLRAAGRKDREAEFPRPVLQRLVLGRQADPTPDRPLPGLSPAAQVLGGAARLMVIMNRTQVLPPWAGSKEAVVGEENPVRLATGIARWWKEEAPEGIPPAVAVGTDPARSFERSERAPKPGANAALLLPEEGFPGTTGKLGQAMIESWAGGKTATTIGEAAGADLVVLVSGEAPDLLGRRLRALARDPAMKGRLLAVWPLAAPLREDLPASLLAEGNLGGIGVAEWSPVDLPRVAAELGAFGQTLRQASSAGTRIDAVPSPFLWYF